MHKKSEIILGYSLWPDAIVVYPQGLDQHVTGNGWQKEFGEDGNRDLKFFDAMLATLRQKFSVDNERIYTTGFSNGTGFSYCLWAERGNTLAAIGAVAGVLAHSERSKLHQPRPLIAIFRTGPHTASDEIKERTINAARKVDNALASEESCDLKFWLLEHSGGFSLPWFLSISSSHNFSTDGCTRIMLFAAGVELQPDTPLFAREEGQP